MDTARKRLTKAMERRAMGDLGLRWTDVVARSGISTTQLLRIRQGAAPLTPFTIGRLEQALEWEPGSIEAILDGGEPTELGAPPRRDGTSNEEVDDLLERLEALDAERAETLDRLKNKLAALRKATRQQTRAS